MPKTTTEVRLERMRQAEVLMSSDIMTEFFKHADEQLFDRWKHSLAGGKEERELLFLQQLGLTAFKEFMQSCIIDGKMALRDLNSK